MQQILAYNKLKTHCKAYMHESDSPDILALCETNLYDLIGSGNFSVRGYLHLIRNYSTTHMHVSQFMWSMDFLLDGIYL